MRILINPTGIDPQSYVRIQNALVQSHKWFVVDRGEAFRAAMKEQDMTRVNYPTRFDDKEKYARLGKMFGCGGVVQASIQCGSRHGVFSGWYNHCVEYLSLISTSTGEVITSAEDEVNPESYFINSPHPGMSPEWENAVYKLNINVPAYFEKDQYSKEMKEFRQEIKEESDREQEKGD